MATWRIQITEAMEPEESWDDVVDMTLTEEQLDREFDDGYGGTEGDPFLLWTKNNVYFPACYDGAEWAAAVPRNPRKEGIDHVGRG